MADFGAADLDTFRAEVRAWLDANYPPELRDPAAKTDPEAVWGGRPFERSDDPQIVWMRRVAENGWTAPTCPEDYCRGGLMAHHARGVLHENAPRRSPPPLPRSGICILSPEPHED